MTITHMRLKTLRETAGLTLAGLAEKTKGKLSTSRIANYEAGLRILKVEQAIILAKALNVSTAYLLGLETTESEALIENQELSENKKELYLIMQQVARLSDSDVSQATSILKALLKHR